MPTRVIMPALGVAQQTGTLLKWLKSEGQAVTKGEPLMEIETDKATVEIEAAASGILSAVAAKPGDEIPVGQTIALILAPGETLAAESEGPVEAPQRNPDPGPFLPGEGRSEGRLESGTAFSSPTARSGRILASPKARRIAKEHRVDLRSLSGSGPEGSILAADVLRAVGATVAPAHETAMPLSSMRRIVGQRMVQSKQSAPHFYLSMEIDMTAVSRIRSEWKERGDSAIPSLNDFIVYAAARTLKDFPAVNSTYSDLGIQQHADINVGMAVALEEGLVVPVVRNADRLSLSELAARSRELIEKAQTKKLLPPDCEGGTFTVSNLGMLGVDSFIAIINPPQCAILAVGRVAPRVVVDDGMFAMRSMMTATLSADHRIIDGAIGARFLQQLKRRLEAPEF
jgi:pyruvate dehydrogenase E2 component (dihydrolipoamide acetyltransferase)